MKSFYECSFFDRVLDASKFKVSQQVLELDKVLPNGRAKFQKILEKYDCSFRLSDSFSNKKPVSFIPIKDNSDLLIHTVKNLLNFNALEHCNFVIVDDRSSEDLESIVGNEFSYMRIDGNNGFNFSMLNNIPAKIFYDLGCSTMILWNSDLWCMDSKTLPLLIEKHEYLDSTITGTKLIYPPKEMSLNGEEDSENIKKMFPTKVNGQWRETVQFGGDFFADGHFHHYGRFKNPMEYRINCDRPATFLTGAFQIINLETFIKLGGLNPSLSKNFQDNDFCLRVIEKGGKIYYCGEGCGFYHDESALLHDKKVDKQFVSNQILFSKIWQEKIRELI